MSIMRYNESGWSVGGLMQKEMVLQEKNYLEYKNDASMFHMAMSTRFPISRVH